MPLQFDDVPGIQSRLDEKARDLFKAKPGVPQLQLNRYGKTMTLSLNGDVSKHDIYDSSDAVALHEDQSDICQVYFVRQDRSWTTLNISRGMFEQFMAQSGTLPQFWKCVFTFGRKCEENEFEFPAFRARRTPATMSDAGEINGKFGSVWYELNKKLIHQQSVLICCVVLSSMAVTWLKGSHLGP